MGNIPAVQGHPLFGSLREFRSDRAALQLRIAKEHDDIAMFRLGFFKALMMQSPALAHEVLATKSDCFVKTLGLTVFLRPMLGNGLLTSEHAYHARQRKLLAPAFAHRRVSSYAATMAERAARVTVPEGKTFDAAEMLMRLTLEIVGKTLFDVEIASEAEAFGESVTIAMETLMAQLGSLLPLPPAVPTPRNLRTRRAASKLDDIVYRIIGERRREGVDHGDLLGMLLATKDEDGVGLDDKQVRDEAMTFFLAGHETTANALAWTLYLLALNPQARTKMEAELDALGHDPSYDDLAKLPYTLAVLKESMRIFPPVYLLGRRCEKSTTIGGHFVKKNSILMINILGIHRREDLFPDPEVFRPERFLGDMEKQLPRSAYMPFGGGPRVCIGNHFALMEGHVLLATLLRRYRFDLASPHTPVQMEPLVTLRPRGGLMMKAVHRPASAIFSHASS